MNADFLIPKNEIEHVDKIFFLCNESAKYIDKLKKLKDPAIENMYQNGVRCIKFVHL